jgi:hypothetical protein
MIPQNVDKVNIKHVESEFVMATKSLSIRIQEEMLDKLHVVADYEGRSANSQILILIRDCIEAYEEKHGTIPTGKR